MLLQAEHNRNQYQRPVLSKRPAAPLVPKLAPVRQHVGESEVPDLGDVDLLTLEEFAATYLAQRDRLALRQLSGETLSAREMVTLEILTQALEQLLPKPKRIPKPVMKLVREVLRK